jgi:hypothetical protein
MTGATDTPKPASDLDKFNQALMCRAADKIALALRTGQTSAEFCTTAGCEVLTFVATLSADPTTAMFCICVHEKTTGRFVCRSDEMPLDNVRLENFHPEPWFDVWLDESERKPRRRGGELLRQQARRTGME